MPLEGIWEAIYASRNSDWVGRYAPAAILYTMSSRKGAYLLLLSLLVLYMCAQTRFIIARNRIDLYTLASFSCLKEKNVIISRDLFALFTGKNSLLIVNLEFLQ